MNMSQIEAVIAEVNKTVTAFLSGNGPADAITTAAALGSAILTKGSDPAADLAALQAFNKFNSDVIAAKVGAAASN